MIFIRHPPLPRYKQISDINQVLEYYTNLSDSKELEFKYKVKKSIILFFILGACRKQALSTINIDNIIFADNKIILLPNKTLKHTNPNKRLEPLTYYKYEAEGKSCLASCLQSHLQKQNYIVNREDRELFITFGKLPKRGLLHRFNLGSIRFESPLQLGGLGVCCKRSQCGTGQSSGIILEIGLVRDKFRAFFKYFLTFQAGCSHK